MSIRDICWGVPWSDVPPSCADRLEIWEPEPPWALWACNRPEQRLLTSFTFIWFQQTLDLSVKVSNTSFNPDVFSSWTVPQMARASHYSKRDALFCKGKLVGSGFVVLDAVHGRNVSICTGLDNKIYLAINHNEENPLLRKSSIIKFTKTITNVLSWDKRESSAEPEEM